MRQYIDFLKEQAPFDGLAAPDLEALARHIEVEYIPAGTEVISAGESVLDHLYLIRKGAVDVVDRGRVVDQLGPGDVVGHISMLSGLPPPLTVRTSEDTLFYRLPDPRLLVSDPKRLRFQNYGSPHVRTRAVQDAALDAEQQPVGRYLRPVVWVHPEDTLAEAAARITDVGHSCALVHMPQGIGIVTDASFRRACGIVAADARVVDIAVAPVFTVQTETTRGQAYVRMVDLGVHHLVVVDGARRVVGVVRAIDLAAADMRDPLIVRAAIESASSMPQLVDAATLLPSTSIELVESGLSAERVGRLLTAVRDALLRKLVELAHEAEDPPCSWLLLGSTARFEPLLGSDVDTAMAWPDAAPAAPDPGHGHRERADRVLARLEQCGLRRCAVGINASNPYYSRSISGWAGLADRWQQSPDRDQPLLMGVATDLRPVTDVAIGLAVVEGNARRPYSRDVLAMLLKATLAVKPPVGFVRGLVAEHSGEHRGLLDLRRRGLTPIASIGRWVALVTGETAGSTPDRLRRGQDSGMLAADETDNLLGAFELIYNLLLRHQVVALRSEASRSDATQASRSLGYHLDPRTLDPLTRRHLRSVFREVSRVQARLESEGVDRLP
ncbi:MAG: putative nucleotidyltransferase substrate binding domain-containing protein [Actinomycetes bacterium]